MTVLNCSVLRKNVTRVQEMVNEVDELGLYHRRGCALGAARFLARLTQSFDVCRG